jgi:hypothetical protein
MGKNMSDHAFEAGDIWYVYSQGGLGYKNATCVYDTYIHKILYMFSTLSQSQQEDFKFVNNYMGSSLVMMSAN